MPGRLPFPRRLNVQLIYGTANVIGADTALNVVENTMELNVGNPTYLNNVDTASQPRYFDQLGAIYRHYISHAMKVRITMRNLETFDIMVAIQALPQNDTFFSNFTTFNEDAMQLPDVDAIVLRAAGTEGDTKTFSKYYSATKILGRKRDNTEAQGTFTANTVSANANVVVRFSRQALSTGTALNVNKFSTNYTVVSFITCYNQEEPTES